MPEPLLVVALSARALARSASRAGLSCVALDAFADEDTRALAQRWARIEAREGGLDAQALRSAALRLRPRRGYAGLVYGAGLGHAPWLLRALAGGAPVLGNPPQVLRRRQEPRGLFAALDRLGIAYPQTRFSPAPDEGWLLKRAAGSGGMQVRPWRPGQGLPRGAYLQRRVPGAVVSVLFLAAGGQVRIVGFNTLWRAEGHPTAPFAYGGAVNRAPLSPQQRRRLADWARALTGRLGLRGLNTLDAVCDGEILQLLELNPRPGATFTLYDQDIRGGLVQAHIQACRGRLPPAPWPPRCPPRAHLVVYAPRDLRIPRAPVWPEWVSDRPAGDALVRRGEPLCTVHAEGAQWKVRIQARRDRLLASLAPLCEVA